MSHSIGVILPAAGFGSRLGGQKKQFRELSGESVVRVSARLFEGIADDLVVVVPEEDMVLAGELLEGTRARFVAGGATRNASVRNGFEALGDVDWVVVHDAVRPFVSRAKIKEVVACAKENGAAALAVALTDTARSVAQGNVFGDTIERGSVWRMQTPQVFAAEILRNAFLSTDDTSVTDEVALVQSLGHAVHVVVGESTNIKLTVTEDWELAQALWSARTG